MMMVIEDIPAVAAVSVCAEYCCTQYQLQVSPVHATVHICTTISIRYKGLKLYLYCSRLVVDRPPEIVGIQQYDIQLLVQVEA